MISEGNIKRKRGAEPAYIEIYKKLRDEILSGAYGYGAKMPSKRTISADMGVSVITTEHALDLLIDEGYVESRERSGYYVTYRESDGFASTGISNVDAAIGVGSINAASGNIYISHVSHPPIDRSEISELFPFSAFAKTMRKVLSDYGEDILTKCPNEGCEELREAIAKYLARSRNIRVNKEQIIIGSGAEYLYGQIIRTLGRNLVYGIEKPSYEKIEQIYKANGLAPSLLALGQDGILSDELDRTDADVLHITPYRSYPSGVSASAAKRREYIRWADAGIVASDNEAIRKQRTGRDTSSETGEYSRYIIEDDFESEFTPSRKPEETVFSLSKNENVIYLNSFSKTIAPSIRIAYMVLPKKLIDVYEKQAGFYSCAVPTFEQYVLAEFINNGDFERHINRVRRHNRQGVHK